MTFCPIQDRRQAQPNRTISYAAPPPSLRYSHHRAVATSEVMAPQVPSIQPFFQPEVLSLASHKPSRRPISKADMNDGFTSSEVEAAFDSALHKWQPRMTYDEVDIGSLVPGPGCVAVTGRVVNSYDQTMNSKMPQAARGCLRVIVRDDTGTFAVNARFSGRCNGVVANELVQMKVSKHINRSSSGTPKSITSSVSATSSQFGHHTSPAGSLAPWRCRMPHSSLLYFPNGITAATSWYKRTAMKVSCARHRKGIEMGKNWMDSSH